MHTHDRRSFLKSSLQVAAGLGLAGHTRRSVAADQKPLFKISLAEWSFHKALFKKEMDHLDFARVAKKDFGIEAVEYVNQFFKEKAKDTDYLKEMKKRCDDLGVRSVLIMCDGEGALGDADEAKRMKAVENHYQWVEAAKFLGCHSIRVNAYSTGSYDEQLDRAADGLAKLTEFGAKNDINVIVENHGGLSSNGKWLSAVMTKVNNPRCGTLPDFGNFPKYDRYQGVREMMPFAKGVSAKSYDFDAEGNETTIDYRRMMKIVLEAGYHGHLGIEYEGKRLPEPDGVRATKKLLERIRDELATDQKR
jgi:L-ribulose-5-phosphate 3-epimerase